MAFWHEFFCVIWAPMKVLSVNVPITHIKCLRINFQLHTHICYTKGSFPNSLCNLSGLQKGPAEKGHVKKRQKSPKSVKKFLTLFRQFSRRAKNVKNPQKASKSFSTHFNNFRAAPFFRPLLGGSDNHFGPHSTAFTADSESVSTVTEKQDTCTDLTLLKRSAFGVFWWRSRSSQDAVAHFLLINITPSLML